jgi:hypothetical protein
MVNNRGMRYLCLIHLDESVLAAIPRHEESDLNAAHWDYNDRLRASGNFIAAEALAPAAQTTRVTVRNGKTSIVDGPFTETKEVIAGFYLIEACDLDEAVAIASKLPSATIGTVEVRPARQLSVEGREPRWG